MDIECFQPLDFVKFPLHGYLLYDLQREKEWYVDSREPLDLMVVPNDRRDMHIIDETGQYLALATIQILLEGNAIPTLWDMIEIYQRAVSTTGQRCKSNNKVIDTFTYLSTGGYVSFMEDNGNSRDFIVSHFDLGDNVVVFSKTFKARWVHYFPGQEYEGHSFWISVLQHYLSGQRSSFGELLESWVQQHVHPNIERMPAHKMIKRMHIIPQDHHMQGPHIQHLARQLEVARRQMIVLATPTTHDVVTVEGSLSTNNVPSRRIFDVLATWIHTTASMWVWGFWSFQHNNDSERQRHLLTMSSASSNFWPVYFSATSPEDLMAQWDEFVVENDNPAMDDASTLLNVIALEAFSSPTNVNHYQVIKGLGTFFALLLQQ
eukprot:GILJ01014631.1.p2 GENE.GILJ01014631.1~~GILJ01014631.1.p2  ORF type:complete len:376 (-),score=37.58 GILJ01014631.1:2303-3430(-)